MFETNVNVNVKCPDLLMAATVLAKALGKAEPHADTAPAPVAAAQPQAPARVAPTAAPQMPQPAAPQMPHAQPAPVTPFPAAAPAAVQTPMPGIGAPTVPTAPTAPAPAFTLDQVGRAGAELIGANPGKMAELSALLQQFGIPAITELKPEQIGPSATALRGLGARI